MICAANPSIFPCTVAAFCTHLLEVGVTTLLAGGTQSVTAHPQAGVTVLSGKWSSTRLVRVGDITFALSGIDYVVRIKFYEHPEMLGALRVADRMTKLPVDIKLRVSLAAPKQRKARRIIDLPEDSPLRVLARQLASDLRNLQAYPCTMRGSNDLEVHRPPQSIKGPLTPCQNLPLERSTTNTPTTSFVPGVVTKTVTPGNPTTTARKSAESVSKATPTSEL